jgi:hypothetical protein
VLDNVLGLRAGSDLGLAERLQGSDRSYCRRNLTPVDSGHEKTNATIGPIIQSIID